MRVWRSAERKISLNFGAESFSQRNCIVRRDSRLLSCEGSSSEILVLIFSQLFLFFVFLFCLFVFCFVLIVI